MPATEPLNASRAAVKVLCLGSPRVLHEETVLWSASASASGSRANRVWPLRAFVESHVLRELCYRLRTVLRSEVPGLMLLRADARSIQLSFKLARGRVVTCCCSRFPLVGCGRS